MQKQLITNSFPLLNSSKSMEYNINPCSKSMKEMCKIQKDALSLSQLTPMISRWMLRNSEHNHCLFKVSIRKMKQIDQDFKQKCLSYLILRKFKWIIRDLKKESIIYLNQQLKSNYQKLMFNSIFKDSITFQIFIIYIIKKTTQFLMQNFNNLLVDFTLQSEMSIILYYTLLGVEVSEKIYEIIHRKYVLKGQIKLQTAYQTLSKEEFKSSKNSFMESSAKTSKKLTNFLRFNKGTDQFRNSRQSLCRIGKETTQKQQLSDFTTLLKQNLHVDPLPPLKRKKVNIRELEHLNTQPSQIINSSFSLSQNEKSLDLTAPCKKKCFYSNQLSNSFKIFHPDNLIFELNSKKVKLNQSSYHFQNNKKKDERKTSSEQEKPIYRSVESESSYNKFNSQKGTTNWQELVRQLKKKTMNMKNKAKNEQNGREQDEIEKKLNHISEQSSLRSTQYQIKQIPPAIEDTSNNLQLNTYNQIDKEIDEKELETMQGCFKRECSKQFNERFSIKTFQQGPDSKIKGFYQKKGRHEKLKKNSIRLDKDSFFSSCSARKSELMDLQKINLHADWILNHYKE